MSAAEASRSGIVMPSSVAPEPARRKARPRFAKVDAPMDSERTGRPLGGVRGPFQGFSRLRVLDFTKLVPGPYAAQVLGDLGCRVTKVELPHFADGAREMPPLIDGEGAVFRLLNRGKTLLSLDFRKPAGLKKLLGLVAKSDVAIEGFRPGLMDRVGLGWDALRSVNPRLVYCSLVG